MPDKFQHDPITGVTDWFDYDEATGQVIIRSTAEIGLYLDRNAEARNTNATDKGLIDNGREMHLYAILTPIIMLELRAKGIDIYSKDKTMQRRMFAELEKNYPYSKVTERKHFG